MRGLPLACLLLCLKIETALAAVVQVPLQAPNHELLNKPKKLHGRFLHITDIHPDPHYRPGRSQEKACHRKQKNRDKNDSGFWGTPYSTCDTPARLANFTLDYINDNWAKEIDFVIWTGDNARHDSDRQVPRTPAEIYDLNRVVAAKMEKIFTKRGIPIVPAIGNNDVWPHNIMEPGPNSITNEYSKIWKEFIPFPYLGVFHRGGYYTKEIVPDQLAVISLNTMYFYDSNKVVNGCPFREPDDPGNLQLDWLEVQLKEFLDRGMQTYIIGHVPPSPGNYFPECFVRYAELALRFQNIILGHLFGHMNVDHFFFLEDIDLEIVPDEERVGSAGNDAGLYETLLTEFSALPGPKRLDMDNYAVVNVAPAVVPDPYLPSFRIFSYNVTDPSYDYYGTSVDRNDKEKENKKRNHGRNRGRRGDKSQHCKEAKYKYSWRCHLTEKWHSDPESPSRTNRFWTPLGYAQYNIPNLHEANKTNPPRFELEYITYDPKNLYPDTDTDLESFVYPVPPQQLPEELRQPVAKSPYAPYRMQDLTIPSWVKLGRRLADQSRVKLRKKFKKYMYGGRKKF
ncbi:endopolyphosphatase [Coprinopsis marcescibilis]|uniref:Endopolyphosphatase n=1 Tax=Coprinopsis marcescibilis TaxID=230819 RepID=A0A5C3KMZ3_COPMA|nr:endopolyphosphatase [Coprinopsis marcescibilis]